MEAYIDIFIDRFIWAILGVGLIIAILDIAGRLGKSGHELLETICYRFVGPAITLTLLAVFLLSWDIPATIGYLLWVVTSWGIACMIYGFLSVLPQKKPLTWLAIPGAVTGYGLCIWFGSFLALAVNIPQVY